jgi:hypothetical protein
VFISKDFAFTNTRNNKFAKNSLRNQSKSGCCFVYIGMITRPQNAKLKELRARTDRELITWIDRRLDLGLESYGAAAEEIYLEVAPLLLVANAGPRDRVRLESKLEQLAECFGATACAAV